MLPAHRVSWSLLGGSGLAREGGILTSLSPPNQAGTLLPLLSLSCAILLKF